MIVLGIVLEFAQKFSPGRQDAGCRRRFGQRGRGLVRDCSGGNPEIKAPQNDERLARLGNRASRLRGDAYGLEALGLLFPEVSFYRQNADQGG
jgi:hypothetical protein